MYAPVIELYVLVVWVYSPRRYVGRSPKFQRNYSGPFLIIRQLGPVLYVVQKSHRSKENVVHADKLKLCFADHPPSWLPGNDAGPDKCSESGEPAAVLHEVESEKPNQQLSRLRAEAPPFIPPSLQASTTPPLTRPKRLVNRPSRYRQ